MNTNPLIFKTQKVVKYIFRKPWGKVLNVPCVKDEIQIYMYGMNIENKAHLVKSYLNS